MLQTQNPDPSYLQFANLESETCTVCKGSGEVYDFSNFGDVDYGSCPACNGDGSIHYAVVGSNEEVF